MKKALIVMNSSRSFFFILVFASMLMSACRKSKNADVNYSYQNYQASEAKEIGFESKDLRVYNKRNLQSLMLGKNKIEVEEIMGLPEGKSLDGGAGYLWDYRRPIFDESTEKVYEWSLVSFKFLGGLCSEVRVRLEDPPTFKIAEDINKTIP
tara:strand:- start:150 stop:605 length:456 start_codon:yes stop_codon:yes gene_type:complete